MNMDYQVTFEFMKNCLKKWNYQQIHAMNDTEIAEIFSSSNRPLLVSWLLKHLYPELLSENRNYGVQQLVSFVYDLGLCTKSQKDKIFCTEFYEDQFEVLHKIFSLLDKISAAPVVVKPNTKITIEELEDFLSADLNLFPCYGPISVLTDEKREPMKVKLESQMHLVEHPEQTSEEVISDPALTFDAYSKDVGKVMEELKLSVPEFVTAASSFCDQGTQEDSVTVNEELESTIKKCGEDIQKLSQYFRDVKTLTDFAAGADETKPDAVPCQERDAFVILENLAKQTKDVVNAINLMNGNN